MNWPMHDYRYVDARHMGVTEPNCWLRMLDGAEPEHIEEGHRFTIRPKREMLKGSNESSTRCY